MIREYGLAGKTAVITGGGGGVGTAVAERLQDEGANVVVVDVSADRVEATLRRLDRDRAAGCVADVSAEQDVDGYIGTAIDRFGGLDLFVNNAAVLERVQRPIHETPLDEFERVYAVNVRGVFLGLRAAIRQMIAQGRGGAIVNVASIGALRSRAETSLYGTSKRAVIGFSGAAATEVGSHGIRVNCICPGQIDTDMIKTVQLGRAALASSFAARALDRAAAPAEIAALIAYLLGDQASYQTGGVYTIDGGTVV